MDECEVNLKYLFESASCDICSAFSFISFITYTDLREYTVFINEPKMLFPL